MKYFKGFKIICICFALLFCQSQLCIAQDQRLADSLEVLYEKGGYQSDELLILREIAKNEQNPDVKLEYAQKLIEKASSDSSLGFLYSGYLQKGNALQQKGDYSNTLKAYLKCLDYADKLGDEIGSGLVMVSIADTYSMIGNAKNAMLYYRKGIGLQRKTNDSINLATALLNAGDEFFYANQLDSALVYFKESGQIFKEINYLNGTAYNLGNLGMVYAELGQDNQAESNINEAISILEELEDYYPITVYLTYMSDIYVKKQDLQTAFNYSEKSLEFAYVYGLKDQISEAHLKLSELYEQAGDTESSLEHFRDHVAYRDSIRNLEAVQEMADLRTDYEVSQKQTEVDLLNEQKRNQRIITIGTVIGLILVGLIAAGLYRRNRFIKRTNEIIATERDRSDNLLLNILPEKTAAELKEYGKVKADSFDSVSVLFTDFKGFTSISEKLSPELLVQSVDHYFSKFDEIMEKHGLEKIKTIGDAYMCAGGLPFPSEDHAERMILAAREIVDFVKESKENGELSQAPFDIRVGINTGPVVAGVVGTKKFSYDIWGDTVNVASRMESNSEPGKINISENTYKLVKDKFNCTFRGEIDVKNRGSLKMYFVEA